jgi:regulation of enolase protein 1 (concanavalin A-like superfamily)
VGALVLCAGALALTAQTSRPTPSVSIRRVTSLNSNVVAGDFNGDGIVDLASMAAPASPGVFGAVVVATGRGDGSFNPPIATSVHGRVLAAGDLNRDGKADLVVFTHQDFSPVVLLPGRGDGTFGAPLTINSSTTLDVSFGLVADLNGDGKLDVLIGYAGEADDDGVVVSVGNGDGTFSDGPTLFTGTDSGPSGGVVADFNGDGRPDLAVANHNAQTVSVFLNHGAFTFTTYDRGVGRQANDVAAADLNRDGKVDLVVAESGGDNGDGSYNDGAITVFPGNGDGTFGFGYTQGTANGAWRVVVGDFNRDGIPDVATANRSAIAVRDCGPLYKTWDSVTINNGNGDGTFSVAANFSIGDQTKLDSPRYRNAVSSLVAADVNGDHWPDLIASDGVVFIGAAPDPDWPPAVSAGANQTIQNTHQVTLRAVASDSDQDVLLYSWASNAGVAIPNVPNPCITVPSDGTYTFTVTVHEANNSGHTTSASVTDTFSTTSGTTPPAVTVLTPKLGEMLTEGRPYVIKWTATPRSAPLTSIQVSYRISDGSGASGTACANLPPDATQCTWTPNVWGPLAMVSVYAYDQSGNVGYNTSNGFSIQPPNPGLPADAAQADIGTVSAAGGARYDGNTGTWTVSGDGADIWGTADAFHYVYTTMSTSEFEVQLRVDSVQAVNAWTKAGIMIRASLDANAVHASIFVTPSRGIQFQRRTTTGGATISTAEGPDYAAPAWLRLTKVGTTIASYYRKNLTDPWSQLFTQTMDGLPAGGTVYVGIPVTSHAAGQLATATFSNLLLNPLPSWSSSAIGNTKSSATWNGTVLTMTNVGTDIWGTSDQFVFGWNQLTGDGMITARLSSLQNVSSWTKAGVMMRETLQPGSKQVDIVATPSKGISMQFRDTTGGTTASGGQALVSNTVPSWLRLTRRGNMFTTQWSTDGTLWYDINERQISMPPTVYVGMALTSHSTTTSATASFDDVRIQQ